MDVAVVAIYLVGMIAFGFWGKRRATTQSDFLVAYTFGLLIGQDIWQRVFTARSPGVARWAGAASGVYCLL